MRPALLALLVGCGSGTTTPDAGPLPSLRLELVASGFEKPVLLLAPPGDERLFVVEHAGRVRIVRDGQTLPAPFVDLRAQVRGGGPGGAEEGLEGMAFHPEFADNRRFFLDFIDEATGDTRVVEMHADAGDPDVAAPGMNDVLVIDQLAFSNHKAGAIAFSPRDGQLYIATGDGGDQYDPTDAGQRRDTRLGKILRVTPTPGGGFTVPAGNPGGGGLPEIWAYGLRNPWRIAFDRQTGDLYIADVGQNRWEEVNVQLDGVAGANYGWDLVEGKDHCPDGSGTCSVAGARLPVVDYPHSVGTCVIGGFVYRGTRIPGLAGQYFFADYGSAFVRSFAFDRQTGSAGAITEWPSLARTGITSFGEDASGELYVLTTSGSIYRIEAD